MSWLLGCILQTFIAIVGPFAVVWSVNTLFGTGIEYSVKSWIAVIILYGVLSTITPASDKVEPAQ